MKVDSHHHFWNYDPAAYPWIGEDMAALKHDFGAEEIAAATEGTGIDAVVSVQARQSVRETVFLCEIAASSPLVAGVVGWAPLAEENLPAVLDKVASPWLKGLRHVVQDEDDGFLDADGFNAGVKRLTNRGLVYDILIFGRQLPEAVRFVDRHPRQPFVLDHAAKPTVDPGRFDAAWAKDIRTLAERGNVACKFSGLVTEVVGGEWTAEVLRPYWDTLLEAFGPERLMFGSDWPVCLLRTGYARWVETVAGLAAGLSEDEKTAFWGGTAATVYGLEV